MDHQRIPRQALHWEVPGFKRGPGRPRANWRSIVNKDLGITWEEADVAAPNRSEWRQSVAKCIHLDAGWIKVKVKYWFAALPILGTRGHILETPLEDFFS